MLYVFIYESYVCIAVKAYHILIYYTHVRLNNRKMK